MGRQPDDLASQISVLLEGLGTGPVLVISDLMRAGTPYPRSMDRKEILNAHMEFLQPAIGNRDLWMHTFNYDFPHSRTFDVANEPSQVGPLTDHFRKNVAQWRSTTPIFPFAGTGEAPLEDLGHEIDPFGQSSPFAQFARQDGVVLFYGASVNTATIMHHAERVEGGPAYRYDKLFPGRVTLTDGSVRDVILRYHVRPWESGLDYDHARNLSDLMDAGVLRAWQSGPIRYLAASAKDMVSFWVSRLAEDPVCLLDDESKLWVEPMLERLGRRFELEDFEPAQLISS